MIHRLKLLEIAFLALVFTGVPMNSPQNDAPTATHKNARTLLRTIYEEDQKNRNDIEGDARRRELVRGLIREGKVQSGEDYYYAAFIFQHGQRPSDFLYAHVLAVTAVSKGLRGAMWLSAASLDRYLYWVKQPQIFGTQFGSPFTDTDDQEPYDKEMVSDELRAQWCVAPRSTQDKILSDLRAGKEFGSTRICPLPDAELDLK